MTSVSQYQRRASPCGRLTAEARKGLFKLTRDSARRGIELGATLCAHGNKIELGRTCEGDACTIPAEKFLTGCKPGSLERAGTFHTHVKELPVPSDTDMEISMRSGDEVLCIGGQFGSRSAVMCNYNFKPAGAFYENTADVCTVKQ